MNSGVLTPLLVELIDVVPISKDLFPFLLIIVVALVMLMVLFVWNRRGGPSKHERQLDRTSLVEENLSIAAQPLLTKKEATLYNLVQLAVQDSYLAFVKIPLSRFVTIAGGNGNNRKTILRAIRSMYVDIVLVHPGTLLPVQVISFMDTGHEAAMESNQKRIMRQVLQSAHIEEIQLDSHATYNVSELVELFGLKEED